MKILENKGKKGIKSFSFEELENELVKLGEKKYRATQIFEWLYKEKKYSFDEMTNLSLDLRKKLNENYYIEKLEIVDKKISIDGKVKYLFSVPTGSMIETVIMRYNYGNTACISTQKGCKMGCKFCASTKASFQGNLETGEIIEQVQSAEIDLGEKISNIVFMGIGEPLDNYDNVIRSLNIFTDYRAFEIGARHISISTCGVVDKINSLAELKFQTTLSVSLHYVTDEKRKKYMPINNKWNLHELFTACKNYNDKTKKRISFEYAMVKGVNDSLEDAKILADLIYKYNVKCHVNLININPINEEKFEKCTKEDIFKFRDYLNNRKIVTTIRRKLGTDIEAACGQLRRTREEE